jgi:hypothetical protein
MVFEVFLVRHRLLLYRLATGIAANLPDSVHCLILRGCSREPASFRTHVKELITHFAQKARCMSSTPTSTPRLSPAPDRCPSTGRSGPVVAPAPPCSPPHKIALCRSPQSLCRPGLSHIKMEAGGETGAARAAVPGVGRAFVVGGVGLGAGSVVEEGAAAGAPPTPRQWCPNHRGYASRDPWVAPRSVCTGLRSSAADVCPRASRSISRVADAAIGGGVWRRA